jgi:hypothetical protein
MERDANEGARTPRRSKVCPRCHGRSVATIAYGYPVMDEGMQAELDAGRIAIGGCMVTSDRNPKWHCNDCRHEWPPSIDWSDPELLPSSMDDA